MLKPSEIRSQFIEFFREKGHTVIPSVPVLPSGDPTLLFTNAGMNQFKDVFLEQGSRPYTRAVNSQKCIRVSGKHNDLEEVGPSPHHHTFFEMLGNWSFGDYYKQEAIQWAWELVTGVWKIDPNRLYATIYKGDDKVPPDDEARKAWLELTGIAKDRISYHGKKDNFWEMGEVGPCGPCSELHYDLGPEFCSRKDDKDHKCEVNGDCGRIVELWNLVFIQYRHDEKGELHSLPRRHVDTGGGLERFCRVLEDVNSNYETGLFRPILSELINISGVDYQPDDRGIPHRVAVDHVRSLSFALADGVLPSNDGRGYVLRRILRRAARYGREIGLETPFLYKLVDPLVEIMGDAYPEIKDRYEHITGVIKAEEESFTRTLGRGLELFGGVIERVRKEKSTVIPGDDAFKLYDTYGFPLDLTQLMARERKLTIGVDRFDELMKEQRVRARGEGKFDGISGEFTMGLKSEFVGYTDYKVSAKVVAIEEKKGTLELVLDRTPFYAEAGGQVSDHGWIEWNGNKHEVTEVGRVGDVITHRVKWKNCSPPHPGDVVTIEIDKGFRLSVQYNHTATHLLHTALRKHLGMHTNQAGSLVAPDHLRFDFTHFEKLSPEQLEQIEIMVNQSIREDYPVKWYVKPYKEALSDGITALFGEKYGEKVRIVHIGSEDNPYSRELCGGTHVDRTGQIGLFRITSESAVSAGVRRIEAVTGEAALKLTLAQRNSLNEIANLLGSHGSDPVLKLEKTLEEKRSLEKEFEKLLKNWADSTAMKLLSDAETIDGIIIISKQFKGIEIDRMKLIGDQIRARNSHAVALLAGQVASGAGQLCCVVGDALIKEKKLKAGELVSKAARLAGGGGGGKPHMATAGTKSPDKLNLAIDGFLKIVRETL
ncbi:MAG: alanine--tRNA ligase [Candidatus Hatepunaea meridiana]|nr:alanine--tRNA ligase [Candidatus Hatepunaea meridiana]